MRCARSAAHADYSAFSINRKGKGVPMTEYEPSPVDDELEATIRQLFYRMDDTREGHAEHKMIVRQLIGLREGSEVGRLILEEFNMIGIAI